MAKKTKPRETAAFLFSGIEDLNCGVRLKMKNHGSKFYLFGDFERLNLMNMSQTENSIQSEDVPWSDLAVIVCSKCQTLFPPGTLKMTGDVADQLKNLYKKRLKDEGLSDRCRVMVSGCQHICLEQRQSMTFFPQSGPTKSITMHPDVDVENVYQMIQQTLSQST